MGKANKRSSGIDTRNTSVPLLIEVFLMPFIHRKLVTSLSLGLLLVSASTAIAGDCKPLMKQIEPYDRALKEALDDEPEDLPKELRRHAEFMRSGQTDRSMAIDHEIRSGRGSCRGPGRHPGHAGDLRLLVENDPRTSGRRHGRVSAR